MGLRERRRGGGNPAPRPHPGGRILLRPAGSAAHLRPPPPSKKKIKKIKKERERERENKKPSLVISVNLEQGTASRQQASKAVRKPQIPTP